MKNISALILGILMSTTFLLVQSCEKSESDNCTACLYSACKSECLNQGNSSDGCTKICNSMINNSSWYCSDAEAYGCGDECGCK